MPLVKFITLITVLFYMVTTIDAFRDYLQREKKYSPHTVSILNDIILPDVQYIHFDQENIDQVSYSQIRNWIVSLVDAGMSNVSVNRRIASLKAFYKFLM
jgi:integrase/recombinase XerC